MASIRVINFGEPLFIFFVRFSMITLGTSNDVCNWHVFTVSILEVLNNFIKPSYYKVYSDLKSVLVNGQTSLSNIAELVDIYF